VTIADREPATHPTAVPDAYLVAAALSNPSGFAAIYDRYADRLHDFCVGMLRDRDAAADCVQDTFTTAATRLAQLRERDKLRPWLYAIARHEALVRLRARRREQPIDEFAEAQSSDPEPDVLAARSELARLVAQAAGGLAERDRTLLELAYHQGLEGPELADALGVSPSNANTMLGRLRTTVERSLGALLVARRRSRDCPELAALLAGWDGQFSVLWRKRIARHIEGCAGCDTARRAMVTPKALLGAAPMMVPAPLALRAHTLANAAPALHVAAASGAAHPPGSSWWPPRRPRRPRPSAGHLAGAGAGIAAAAAAAALLVPTAATPDPQPVAVIAPSAPSLITVTQGTRTVVTAAPRQIPGPQDTVTAAPQLVPGPRDTATVPGPAPAVVTVTVAAPPVTVTAPPPPPVISVVTKTVTKKPKPDPTPSNPGQ
jgi:RNA polymerase sigma factor (sigma-70 family)